MPGQISPHGQTLVSSLEQAASGIGLTTAFQPIVSLADNAVIGYEALSRWPSLGLLDATPVLAHAEARGCIDQLEQTCIEHALAAARETQINDGALLSINSEVIGAHVRRRSNGLLAEGADRYQIMFELTERNLFNSPAALLDKVDALRSDGFAVALDDVGAHRDSCALLDVICPDVIKLDLELVQRNPSVDQARTLAAVLAHRERTGTVILAEGIETERHLEQALAIGADLGQGYLFGRPAATPLRTATAVWPLPVTTPGPQLGGTPFDYVKDTKRVRTVRKETLLAFSRTIENQVLAATDNSVVLASLQHGRFFTSRTRRNYFDLAETHPLVAVFGEDLSQHVQPAQACEVNSALRLVDLKADDPLTDEWLVIALGGHTAVASIARERHDGAHFDEDRRFDFTITHDRRVIAAAVRNLMSRIGER